jgi:hypothetical protein
MLLKKQQLCCSSSIPAQEARTWLLLKRSSIIPAGSWNNAGQICPAYLQQDMLQECSNFAA